MDTDSLIQAISAEDADFDYYAQLSCADSCAREAVVEHMLTDPAIMAYYHCFYVVDRASRDHPALFLPYWDPIAALLHHPNSYHRDFALTILPNLLPVDQENRFAAVFADYFTHRHDAKFMTGRCCVQNSLKIIRARPELRDAVLALLLDVDRGSAYSENQQALLKCDVLDVLDAVYGEIQDKESVDTFIQTCAVSRSPKTRKRAREMMEK